MVDPIAGSVTPSCEAVRLPQEKRWPRCLGALLCIGVSGLFLYLAVRTVDPVELVTVLAGVNLLWLVPLVTVSLIELSLRTVRWRCMFPPHTRPTVRQTFSVFMIGTMTNNFVPGRLGDVARAGMMGRLVPLLGTSAALASIVLEKVLDGLMLLVLMGLTFLLAPLPAWMGKIGALGSLLFLGTLLLLLGVNAYDKAHKSRPNITSQKIVLRIQSVLQRFAFGLNALRSKRQFLTVLLLTISIWLLEFSSIFIGFQAFGLNLPFLAAVVSGVVVSVGVMIPAAPGTIGTYQFFTITGLQLYDVPVAQALALAVFLNLYGVAITTLMGLIALSVEGIGWSRGAAIFCPRNRLRDALRLRLRAFDPK